MSILPSNYSPPVTRSNLAIIHYLLGECAKIYKTDSKTLKTRLKSNVLFVQSIKEIDYLQYQIAIDTLIKAIKKKNPSFQPTYNFQTFYNN